MFALFAFPISDARGFAETPGLRRDLPDWPDPQVDIHPQFVHYFGRAVSRRRPVDDVFPHESRFCQARRALRFVQLKREPLGFGNEVMWPHCCLRRVFFDGECVGRIEVGITADPRAQKTSLTPRGLFGICVGLSQLNTLVPQPGLPPRTGKLIGQGPALAKLFARATLPSSGKERLEEAAGLVDGGNPLLIVEVARKEVELNPVPAGFQAVNSARIKGATLLFGRLRTSQGFVATWILRQDNASDDDLRNLRICLVRLHAEQEALDGVLRQLKRGRLKPETSDHVDLLDRYLNKQTKLLSKDERGGIDQRAIIAAYDAADIVIPASAKADLVERYDGARAQVWQKVQEYQARRAAIRHVEIVNVGPGGTIVDKSVTVNQTGNGIVNVAEYMSGVTNTVNTNLDRATSQPSEAKELVKALTEQIGAIAGKVDPKHTENMADSVQAISKEMTKQEPRREWYEVSLKGLKEAAEAVGEVGVTIATTVKKLWPLLLP